MTASTGSRPAAPAPSFEPQPLVEEVERVLCEMAAQIQRLSSLASDRREAMRRADTDRLARCIADENDAVQRVAELEKRRLAAVGPLAERLGSPERTQTSASWIADRVGGRIGQRLRERAAELRQGIETLQRLNDAAQHAAVRLAAHMEGLWRQASQSLNESRTYSRRGAVLPGATVVSGLDVRT